MTIRDDFLLYVDDIETLAKLHPFVAAHRSHGLATYQLLCGADRRLERYYAHIAGEWRHPACGDDDKAMDVVTEQHQTNRSWQHCYCLLSEKPAPVEYKRGSGF